MFTIKKCFLPHKTLQRIVSYRCLSGLNLWDQEISSEIKHEIEKHWKDKLKFKSFEDSSSNKEKYYVLSMFPYPSGALHMGHVRVYTISDTVARYQRLNGKNVLHPIGWDAFGLPAENAAIDHKIAPDVWTKQNIAHMKEQLERLNCSFEWNREFKTCDPNYYKWTQDLFLKLYDEGLVYQKEALVNWDPVDQTVLADEQVDENGNSWRSGAKVEKRVLKQWYVRTTRFAKNLLDGLNDPILQDWRDIIKLQKHWIGDCDGVNFDFTIEGNNKEFLTLWTSTPEYVENVKFVAVTSDNILAKKEGVKLKGEEESVRLRTHLINPINCEKIPVYVTNEVEFLPLTDSYIGIPGILEEATNFARKHSITFENVQLLEEPVLEQKRNNIINKARELKVGGYWTSAKLRDWLISRQRYWGTPIPIVHCKSCGPQPVPRKDLPVILPELKHESQKSGSQLAELSGWLNTTCPKCGGTATRETDTMDTFVDSSWYFLRFPDPHNEKEIFSKEAIDKVAPVDLYIGGKEHAVLHMYYARFIMHFLHSLGLVPEKEPFKRLLVQGMVMGRSYRIKGTGRYVRENEVKILDLKRNKAITKDTNEPVIISWEKMSKSKYNGVDPEDMFREYGTDTTRLLVLADVAPTSHRNWNNNTFPGVLNWQRRLWLTMQEFLKHRNTLPLPLPEAQFKIHDTYMYDSRNYYVKGVSYNYLITQQISVAVSKQQGLTNSLRRVPPSIIAHSRQFERAFGAQIIMLAPMAPCFASELWSGFTSAPNRLNTSEFLWDTSVFEQDWPVTDMDYMLELICQVNGHENAVLKMSRQQLEDLSKDAAYKLALEQKEVQSTLRTRNILDSNFTLRTGFEAILNLITDHPPPKAKITELEEARAS
ncbi:probable leucine--tRNA ligase, mitochondrial [Diabrotica virgifera virgifera]|uniref:leucine--tRNA ligase n=1 Tax=Diabrotica virgifera virgifera TaxID=50390 RepID=A0A6P7GR88_DIAVI|nr:probable leucine--tRNA ligase, mitochondrial [Diabrotica virgifera virgifera]